MRKEDERMALGVTELVKFCLHERVSIIPDFSCQTTNLVQNYFYKRDLTRRIK